MARCRRTRQIVAYVIGSRGEEACRLLWERVPAAYKGGLCCTDFGAAYAEVLPQEQHRATGKGAGQTNHVERFNNVLRQRLGRLVRRTLSFSKSDVVYEACLLLFLHEHSRTSTTSRPGISPGESDSIKPLPFYLPTLPWRNCNRPEGEVGACAGGKLHHPVNRDRHFQ